MIGVVLLFEASYGVAFFGLGFQMLVAIAITLFVIAGIIAWLLYAAVRAQYRRVKTGEEALIGAIGSAVTDLAPKGEVRVNGEFWRATTKEAKISNGQIVIVVGLEGMFLTVKPVEEKA